MGGKVPNKPHTIYAIQCTENQRVYVGCTSDFDSRIRTHFSQLRHGDKMVRITKGKRGKSLWQLDYDKFGGDAFKVYILENSVPPDKALRIEKKWIDEYDATNPRFGYNQGYHPRKSIYEPFTLSEGKPTNPSKQ